MSPTMDSIYERLQSLVQMRCGALHSRELYEFSAFMRNEYHLPYCRISRLGDERIRIEIPSREPTGSLDPNLESGVYLFPDLEPLSFQGRTRISYNELFDSFIEFVSRGGTPDNASGFIEQVTSETQFHRCIVEHSLAPSGLSYRLYLKEGFGEFQRGRSFEVDPSAIMFRDLGRRPRVSESVASTSGPRSRNHSIEEEFFAR